jgi:hypothetical protein
MLPPEWVVKGIERLDKHARLAWTGGDIDPAQYADLQWDWLQGQALLETFDALNKGQFYIVKLFHPRDSARSHHGSWDSAGPVFGTYYDPLQRIPHIITPVTKQSVCNGAAIRMARDLLAPWEVPHIQSLEAADKQYIADRQDQAEAAGDYLWHKANRPDSGHTVLAKKFVDERQKKVLSGDYERPSDTYHRRNFGQ